MMQLESEMNKMYSIRPNQILQAAKSHGIDEFHLDMPPVVMLTFNKTILDELQRVCRMTEWNWLGWNYSPYAVPRKAMKGRFNDTEVAVLIPPMGASPLVALCEELIFFGTSLIFLLCASWSLGEEYLERGEIHLPSFSVGLDGTSPHYGNRLGRVIAEPQAHQALLNTLTEFDVSYKVGGIGTCEALYRITRDLMQNYSDLGCLSMDNGETAALYSLARMSNTKIGVLLQPYIDLTKGWDVSFLNDDYRDTCRIQAQVALESANKIGTTSPEDSQ